MRRDTGTSQFTAPHVSMSRKVILLLLDNAGKFYKRINFKTIEPSARLSDSMC
jgi:hypothetical protein